MYLRNSAKAIVIRENRILCVKYVDRSGSSYYVLPGGGQEPGEPIVQALARECHEELGIDVMIGDLAFVREYISRNHETTDGESELHQLVSNGCHWTSWMNTDSTRKL